MDKSRTEKIRAACPNCGTEFDATVTKAQLAELQKTRSAGPFPIPCVLHGAGSAGANADVTDR